MFEGSALSDCIVQKMYGKFNITKREFFFTKKVIYKTKNKTLDGTFRFTAVCPDRTASDGVL